MAELVPNLQVTAPDEHMEISSELGARTHEDIDIDFDISGSGIRSPAVNDDEMFDDLKIDGNSAGNAAEYEFNLDDVMFDDSKPADDVFNLDDIIVDEELQDASDVGAGDLNTNGAKVDDSLQIDKEPTLADVYVQPSTTGDASGQTAEDEEELIDYSDEEPDNTALEVPSARSDDKAENVEGVIAKVPSDSSELHVGEDLVKGKEPQVTEQSIGTKNTDNEQLHKPTLDSDKSGLLGKRTREEAQDSDPHYDMTSNPPSKRPSSEQATESNPTALASDSASVGNKSELEQAEIVAQAENVTVSTGSQLAGDFSFAADDENQQAEDVAEPATVQLAEESNFAVADENQLLNDGNAFNDVDESEDAEDPQSEPLPIPVIVQYEEEEISLFPPRVGQATQTFFLRDESLADKSFHELFDAFRNVLANSVSMDYELELHVPDLDLCINENLSYVQEHNFRQIVDIFVQLHESDGIDEIGSLYVNLTAKQSFAARVTHLQEAVEAGTGFSNLSFLDGKLLHAGEAQLNGHNGQAEQEHVTLDSHEHPEEQWDQDDGANHEAFDEGQDWQDEQETTHFDNPHYMNEGNDDMSAFEGHGMATGLKSPPPLDESHAVPKTSQEESAKTAGGKEGSVGKLSGSETRIDSGNKVPVDTPDTASGLATESTGPVAVEPFSVDLEASQSEAPFAADPAVQTGNEQYTGVQTKEGGTEEFFDIFDDEYVEYDPNANPDEAKQEIVEQDPAQLFPASGIADSDGMDKTGNGTLIKNEGELQNNKDDDIFDELDFEDDDEFEGFQEDATLEAPANPTGSELQTKTSSNEFGADDQVVTAEASQQGQLWLEQDIEYF
ncbi:MAG: hypothetical protein M1820_003551 [Bogoriella megaspora]|nr:MAG: hypothetical protein M1820_003551 [Bogoriella megaspora]